MKNKTILLLLLAAVITVFSGCTLLAPIFGSPDAAILGYSSDAIIGEPAFDLENKAVTVTVKPMDLAAFEPVIKVSEKASLTLPEKIEDGIPAVYRITAENTEVSEWKVTVNVAYGVSFKIDGQQEVLLYGFTNNKDAAAAAELGNGVPGIARDDRGGSYSYVLEKVYDEAEGQDPPAYNYCTFQLSGVIKSGTYEGKDFQLFKYPLSPKESPSFNIDLTVRHFGENLGENFFAAFSGKEKEYGEIKLTEGFAKLMVVERNMPSEPSEPSEPK